MASALIYPWFTYPNMVMFSAKCELTSRVVVHYSGSSVSSPPLIGPLSRGDCRKIQKQVMSFWTPRLAWKGLRPDLTKQETVVLFVLTDERHSHLWVRHIYMHIYINIVYICIFDWESVTPKHATIIPEFLLGEGGYIARQCWPCTVENTGKLMP